MAAGGLAIAWMRRPEFVAMNDSKPLFVQPTHPFYQSLMLVEVAMIAACAVALLILVWQGRR